MATSGAPLGDCAHVAELLRAIEEARRHYWQSRDVERLSAAIADAERLLSSSDTADKSRTPAADILGRTGIDYYLRFAVQRNRADLDRAVTLLRHAVEGPLQAAELVMRLNYLGAALFARFDLFEDRPALDEAVAAFQRAAELVPTTSAERLDVLNNVCKTLRVRYENRRDPEDLQAALTAGRECLASTRRDSSKAPVRLTNYAEALLNWWSFTGEPEVLDGAIRTFKQAVDSTGPDDPELPMYLQRWAHALRQRGEHRGAKADLDEAVVALRRAVTLTGTAPRAGLLAAFAEALLARHRHSGDPADLDEVASVQERALQLAPRPERGSTLQNIASGLALFRRYQSGRRVSDLEQAIAMLRAAVSAAGASTDAQVALNDLGVALWARYKRFGSRGDLDEAIDVSRRSAALLTAQSPHLMPVLSNLAAMFSERSRLTSDAADVERCAEAAWKALQVMPAAVSPMYASSLNTLGLALLAAYELRRDLSCDTGSELQILEKAIDVLQSAARMAPAAAPQRASVSMNLGNALLYRYWRTNDADALDTSISHYEQAANLLPNDSLDKAPYLASLATAYAERFKRNFRGTGDTPRDDLRRAYCLWKDACELGSRESPSAVLHASRRWTDLAFRLGDWNEAARAAEYAFKLVDDVLDRQLARPEREAWLEPVQRLPSQWAYALACAGESQRAVEALERGRSRLLADALERNRRALEHLRGSPHAVMYERFREAAERVESLDRHALPAVGAVDLGHRIDRDVDGLLFGRGSLVLLRRHT